jgi:hypothetical protein
MGYRTIAESSGNGFLFPYLYSVPLLCSGLLWSALVEVAVEVAVEPRAVAEADGLTPVIK